MIFLFKTIIICAQLAFIGAVVYAIGVNSDGHKFGAAPAAFAIGLCYWMTRWLFGLVDWVAARLSGVRPSEDAARYDKRLAAPPWGAGQLPEQSSRPWIGKNVRDD